MQGISKNHKIVHLLILLVSVISLVSCASSEVSRSAATQVDDAVGNTTAGGSTPDPIGSYQTASQTIKGGLLGGAAGAIAGSYTSGVGVIPGAVGGAIFGATLGAYIDTQTNGRDRVENSGAQVIALGDQVKIIIPSADLFSGMTSEIKSSGYETLDQVANYLNSFDKVSVQIAAYTNSTGTSRINYEVSQEQAKKIARYLWMKGVNTRLMTAGGYGGSRLVGQDTYDWNSGPNYRIEITTEKV